ncbi:aminotransferase class V-fold PLP-dependent enzyme [Paenibacillus chitinolyticus]|uniref:aminotransferase class V-fold PLP-dependent enzyme n=1 Tax=Paenibacillus chitinolyticus TaxID=79263 RepID=UPI0036DF881F
MEYPFDKERQYFPILKNKIQLSSCSQSAMSLQVEAAMKEYTDGWLTEGMDWTGWVHRVEMAKQSFATLINASSDEIAVLPSVSLAAAAVASALQFTTPRNKVVTTEMDFPSIGHVWLAQQSRGAQVAYVPSENNEIPIEFYNQCVDERTLIVSMSHAAYYNGLKQDLKQISSMVHDKGARLFVDAYQSAGCVAIDVKEMDVDFLTAGAQKYLLGIPGIAFLYVKKELADELQPSITGWFGRIDPFSFDVKSLDYAEGARRFDTGTPPMINAYAAHAALELINQIGVHRIESYLNELSSFAVAYGQEKGLTIASPLDIKRKAANTAFHCPNASLIEMKMRERGVIVSARNDVIRIAPHFYNKKEEVAFAIDMLYELKS